MIPVDSALIDYFNNFETRCRFTYEYGRLIYVAPLESNPMVDSNSVANRRSAYSMVDQSINFQNPISPIGSRDCRSYSSNFRNPITADEEKVAFRPRLS